MVGAAPSNARDCRHVRLLTAREQRFALVNSASAYSHWFVSRCADATSSSNRAAMGLSAPLS